MQSTVNPIKQKTIETLLTPRFYTTNFEEMAQLNKKKNSKENSK